MYTDKNQPLKGGLSYSPAEIFKDIQAQREAAYNQQQEEIQREQSAMQREYDEANVARTAYINESYDEIAKRSEYLETVKNAFVSECLYKLYKESSVIPLDENDKLVARNLVTKFVKENGAWNLVSNFATKNIMLSEFSRICDKYYNKLLECDTNNCDDNSETDELGFLIGRPLKLDNTIGNEFFEELEDVDCSDASKMIKDRVADSIADFIDSNTASKLDYQEVINTAKDQIDQATEESYAEDITSRAKRQIIEMETFKEKSIFQCLVESLTKAVFKDDNLKSKYITEGSVDMESIVNSATLMYTMLEMVNTAEICPMNEEFIDEYLRSINAV
jgi:hypothetical protein